ncbi:segregation/condensation protein A [Candidatus Saganbacteria bacterium]|uniref:Segregation and condensation protein A n=1 Tax=Candidatus Saganbacteria bacterium TaxID=2575572 RepID=A0A9D6UNT7_UNCSA|nr:segregation/condensation protein A [Candidatus Saganbacteria bacterium]
MTYQVKIEVFEGPFDLLLKAIDEGQIDIYHVSLSQIVASYFEYWCSGMSGLLPAADFLCMAAYLVELKSRGLLPRREETAQEEETRLVEKALLEHIQEYAIYKKMAQDLKQRRQVFGNVYHREVEEVQEKEIELVDVSLRDLVLAFQRIYAQAAERERVLPILPLDENITLEDRIKEITRLLAGKSKGVYFEDLFFRKTRVEIVVTFLAVLELVKQRFVLIAQDRRFGSILVFAVARSASGGEVYGGVVQN